MAALEKNLNALLIYILSGVLISAYGVQFLYHEEPCPLCMLQRLGMIGVAAGAALNLRFGIQPRFYGLSIINALMGGFVALRQISLHVCPGTPHFGFPVLGLSLYSWSFVVFVCSILFIALLLMFFNSKFSESTDTAMNGWQKGSLWIITFICLANVITTFMKCGLGPCTE